MKIHFAGAARTTTGSMYLLEINGKRLLLECGLYQGHREETTQRNCCIHGEESQCLAHVETLKAMKPKAEVIAPEYKQVVEV